MRPSGSLAVTHRAGKSLPTPPSGVLPHKHPCPESWDTPHAGPSRDAPQPLQPLLRHNSASNSSNQAVLQAAEGCMSGPSCLLAPWPSWLEPIVSGRNLGWQRGSVSYRHAFIRM